GSCTRLLLGSFFFLVLRRPLCSTLFPYTTLFRSCPRRARAARRGTTWCTRRLQRPRRRAWASRRGSRSPAPPAPPRAGRACTCRSEEHTSELQSRSDLVCRLLLEKKKKTLNHNIT